MGQLQFKYMTVISQSPKMKVTVFITLVQYNVVIASQLAITATGVLVLKHVSAINEQ